MAQDPECNDEERDQDQLLTSTLWTCATVDSSNIDAEVEADMIRGVLDSNGIPTLLMGELAISQPRLPVLVPRGKVMEARRLIEEAQAAGPAAAAAGELASENRSRDGAAGL